MPSIGIAELLLHFHRLRPSSRRASGWEFQGSTGTSRAFILQNQGRVNPCFDRAHPLELTEQPGGEFKVAVHAARTMSGCQDFYASLALVDPSHLEGKFGDGRELQFERK